MASLKQGGICGWLNCGNYYRDLGIKKPISTFPIYRWAETPADNWFHNQNPKTPAIFPWKTYISTGIGRIMKLIQLFWLKITDISHFPTAMWPLKREVTARRLRTSRTSSLSFGFSRIDLFMNFTNFNNQKKNRFRTLGVVFILESLNHWKMW